MKKLVFAVAGYNLAETGRMIEIAREARKQFEIIFASYGGEFEELTRKRGSLLEEWSHASRKRSFADCGRC